MARRERREQPRIPIEVQVHLDPRDNGAATPVLLTLRTRNLNMRGAFLELPPWEGPPPPWAQVEWWTGRLVHIHVCAPPLANSQKLDCEGEVRWVERRGPKRRAVGIGVLFRKPTDAWVEALRQFLDSLVT